MNENKQIPQEGLKIKYNVYKIEDSTPVYDCFVLRPTKDKAALYALTAYANWTKNKELAADIEKWVQSIEEKELWEE